jgi:hypothetical protein
MWTIHSLTCVIDVTALLCIPCISFLDRTHIDLSLSSHLIHALINGPDFSLELLRRSTSTTDNTIYSDQCLSDGWSISLDISSDEWLDFVITPTMMDDPYFLYIALIDQRFLLIRSFGVPVQHCTLMDGPDLSCNHSDLRSRSLLRAPLSEYLHCR